jgi:mannose/fructose-specific phosphotransferase system component IIA
MFGRSAQFFWIMDATKPGGVVPCSAESSVVANLVCVDVYSAINLHLILKIIHSRTADRQD